MARYLVLGNQTLGGPALRKELEARAAAEDDCEIHIVVPATPLDHYRIPTRDGQPITIAEHRLQDALGEFASLAADVTGTVGDEHPVKAVTAAVEGEDYDAVIVSTFPPGLSHWLGLDLTSRLSRNLEIPVIHIMAEPTPMSF